MFNGFSNKTSEFLWELSFNNERPWFAEHKEEFEQYMNTPFKALAKEVYTALTEAFPVPGWQVHVSRIYRDARRLYGKAPFHDHLWFTVWRSDLGKDAPCFWFQLDARGYGYGMGAWMLKSSYMQAFRDCIDANPARFKRLISGIPQDYNFEGELYKKPKGDRGELINPWYNRRNPGVSMREDFGGELLTPGFSKKLAGEYKKLMPLYEFYCEFYNIASAAEKGTKDE